MKALLLLPVVVPNLVLAMCLGVSVTGGSVGQTPVYSVATVAAGLSHDPAVWVNRTLLVRGVAEATACTLCPDLTVREIPRPSLRDPDSEARYGRLDLTSGPGDPVLTVLRRVPLVRAILPAPRVIRRNVAAVYRVHLRVGRSCGVCYEAVLRDATP